MKTFVTFLALPICLALAGGCDRRVSKAAQSVRETPTAQREVIRVKPQDSLVVLGMALADAYVKEHPEVSIDLYGNGSVGPRTLENLDKGYFDAVLAFPIARPE